MSENGTERNAVRAPKHVGRKPLYEAKKPKPTSGLEPETSCLP